MSRALRGRGLAGAGAAVQSAGVMRVLGRDDGPAGDIAEGGYAEVDGGGPASPLVELGEFLHGAGEADLEPFDFAEPLLSFGFGDAVEQVVADLSDAVTLVRIGPQGGRGRAAGGYSGVPVHAGPHPGQEEGLLRHAGAARWAFNDALGMKVAVHQQWRAEVESLIDQGVPEAEAREKVRVPVLTKPATQKDLNRIKGDSRTGGLPEGVLGVCWGRRGRARGGMR
ncbi:helix-turn-helix domain-containing protein [Streptomyces halobius]|uniref:Helix-turn-helix domain-containing protein n=1 Tax=Streptomyces halobius TaxID=2879846 RepID=A0ABY4M2V1_9ACTN|nr:helix-turn-helix domain-containing protein [Streptomyces halobius]UQA90670.1 helix-turn-helix domain-containing protein [Streptomyces halobius]